MVIEKTKQVLDDSMLYNPSIRREVLPQRAKTLRTLRASGKMISTTLVDSNSPNHQIITVSQHQIINIRREVLPRRAKTLRPLKASGKMISTTLNDSSSPIIKSSPYPSIKSSYHHLFTVKPKNSRSS